MFYKNIALSEGIDLNKSKDIKEGIVCHYWQLNHGFVFQKSVCNGFQDLLMMSPDINDIAVLLSKVMIIIVFFMVLANLMQLNSKSITILTI